MDNEDSLNLECDICGHSWEPAWILNVGDTFPSTVECPQCGHVQNLPPDVEYEICEEI